MKRFVWIPLSLLPVGLSAIGPQDLNRPTPPPEARLRDNKIVEKAGKTEEGVVNDENQVLVESLDGIVIAPDAASALKMQARIRKGVEIEGFPENETAAIRKIAEQRVGKPVTLAGLNDLLEKLEQQSRDHGHMLRRVSFPAQEITAGVVAIRMGPSDTGRVRVSGNPSFGMDFATEVFRIRPGTQVDEAVILDDIEWLNENPLRRATISYAAGEGEDDLDLTLRLKSPKPWRVYGGFDNQLSESLGDERAFLGFQHGNVFGLDHRITAQVTSAMESESLLGASVIHEMPLVGRHLLDVSGGFTTSETDVAGPLDQSGEFGRAAVMHRMQLPRWHGIAHEWRTGMEFRNNDYLFPDGSSQRVRFFQLETGWKGRRADRFGTSQVALGMLYSPGQGVLGSDDEDFIALGADGAESLILRTDLERSLRLGKYGSLVTRLRAQWADSKLLSSDQISAGGMTRVRGYDEVVGYASSGMVGNIEWQSPTWSVPHAGDLLGVCFVDGAVLDRDSKSDPGELLSTGFGARWRWSENFYGRLDCGFPLENPDTIDSNPMWHFAVGFNW
jgi:hemolysin activation/secretion protein